MQVQKIMEVVSFVILHYKNFENTSACVDSILSMDHQERVRIVIVDNDGDEPQEKREALRKYYEGFANVDVLQMQQKTGFSAANNAGYAYARETQKASCIVVANNDIVFTGSDFLEQLGSIFRGNPCHVIGPDIVCRKTWEHQNPMDTRLRTREEADYTIRMNRLALRLYPLAYPFVRMQMNKAQKKQFHRKREQEAFYRSVQSNIVPYGACLIFTSDFVRQEEKAFDPETEFYYEEYILAYRCQKKNYRIVYDPSLRVMHEDGSETKAAFQNEKKRLRFLMEKTLEACKVYRRMLDKNV